MPELPPAGGAVTSSRELSLMYENRKVKGACQAYRRKFPLTQSAGIPVSLATCTLPALASQSHSPAASLPVQTAVAGTKARGAGKRKPNKVPSFDREPRCPHTGTTGHGMDNPRGGTVACKLQQRLPIRKP